MKVFVAAAWLESARVRELHSSLRAIDIEVLSIWAEKDGAIAGSSEDLASLSDGELLTLWYENREGIADCDVFIILADTPGREAFAEAEYARILGKPIVWVGRDTLTTATPKTGTYYRVDSDAEALQTVRDLVLIMRSQASLFGANGDAS